MRTAFCNCGFIKNAGVICYTALAADTLFHTTVGCFPLSGPKS